jgi:hypothetical protein
VKIIKKFLYLKFGANFGVLLNAVNKAKIQAETSDFNLGFCFERHLPIICCFLLEQVELFIFLGIM